MQKFSYLIIVALVVVCILLIHDNHGENACVIPAQNEANHGSPSIEVNVVESRKFQADKFLLSLEMLLHK